MKKVYIKTWGCQMNEYDSSLIVSILNKKKEYELTLDPKKADVLVLNTCSIREKAQEKLFHQLGRWKNLKKNNSNLVIAVGGCVAKQEGVNIFKRSKHVDIIFGPQSLHRLSKMIDQVKNNSNLITDLKNYKTIEKFDVIKNTVPLNTRVSSLVAIMEGCNKYCSFCIVPYTRGKEVSRPPMDIVKEIINLSKRGTKEVILLGQNVNSYRGKDIFGKIYNFSKLLYLINNIPEIARIRFITSHPIHFTDELINTFKNISKLANCIHLPVQSGSDKILNLMRRRYSVLQYTNIIRKLRLIRPNIHICSDFIIGFPGETNYDFEQTISLVKNINFDSSFSFLYSSRPGTIASKIKQNTSLEERKKRLYILQKIINQQSEKLSKSMLGSIQSVLVEGVSKHDVMKLSGKTESNRTTFFEGKQSMIGKLVNVKITHVNRHTLVGIVI